jgi:ribosomal protein S18 acetylase RimI-like enzyme
MKLIRWQGMESKPMDLNLRSRAKHGVSKDAGTISPVAVLRDARKSALLWTRLITDIDMIPTSETMYWDGPMLIRRAEREDADAVWSIIGPTIAAGETYALDRDMTREQALQYWMGSDRETFVAQDDGVVVGTYFIRANQAGGGKHVCNCGYMTAAAASGRGVARRMCEHSLDHARARGFRAMQFNFVVSSNERAVGLWQSLGFTIVGRLPLAFDHPARGYVDALVMFRAL